MSKAESTKTGRKTSVLGDSKYNMLIQDPESTDSTTGGLRATGTVADVAVGQEFTLIARCGIDENTPAAATTYTTDFYSKDAPYKLRVLEVRFEVIDLTTADYTDADGGNLDITLQDGDGVASETFSDVLADFALDDDYANGTGATFPTAAIGLTNTVIDVGESLRALVIADPDSVGATNDGVLIDIIVRCMRVQ